MEAPYEPDQDFPYAGTILIGFILLVTVLTVLPYWAFSYESAEHFILEGVDQQNQLIKARIQRIPEPRLQMQPDRDAEAYVRQQQQILNSYGWSDRRKGLVRIPIEEAIERYDTSQRRLGP